MLNNNSHKLIALGLSSHPHPLLWVFDRQTNSSLLQSIVIYSSSTTSDLERQILIYELDKNGQNFDMPSTVITNESL